MAFLDPIATQALARYGDSVTKVSLLNRQGYAVSRGDMFASRSLLKLVRIGGDPLPCLLARQAHVSIRTRGCKEVAPIAAALAPNSRIQSLCVRPSHRLAKRNFGRIRRRVIIESLSRLVDFNAPEMLGPAIGGDGAHAVLKAVSPATSLRHLDLQNSLIGVDGAEAISELLSKSSSLASLNLRNNRLGSCSAEHIADALEANSSLIRLDLSFNSLGDAGVEAITEALTSNQRLEELYLKSNNIGDDGGVALGWLISQSNTLRTLSVADNYLGAASIEAIATGLEMNSSLAVLDLHDNDVDLEGAKILASVLKKNRTILDIDLRQCRIGLDGVKIFAAALLESRDTGEQDTRHREDRIAAAFAAVRLKALSEGDYQGINLSTYYRFAGGGDGLRKARRVVRLSLEPLLWPNHSKEDTQRILFIGPGNRSCGCTVG